MTPQDKEAAQRLADRDLRPLSNWVLWLIQREIHRTSGGKEH